MKKYIFLFFIFFKLNYSLYANIDAQIEAIQHASVEERFKLMNAFKETLIQMKEEERIKAMTKLSTKSNNKHAKKALEELKQHANKTQIRRHMQHHQSEEENIANETEDNNEGDNDEN